MWYWWSLWTPLGPNENEHERKWRKKIKRKNEEKCWKIIKNEGNFMRNEQIYLKTIQIWIVENSENLNEKWKMRFSEKWRKK